MDLSLYYPEKKELSSYDFHDDKGNYYRNCIYVPDKLGNNSEYRENQYDLGKRYKKLTGNIKLFDPDYNMDCSILIYGDNKLLYEFEGFKKNETEVPFEVNVTGVNSLTLKMKSAFYVYGDWITYKVPAMYLSDTLLEAE